MIPKIEIYNLEASICKKVKYLVKDYIIKPVKTSYDYIKRKVSKIF